MMLTQADVLARITGLTAARLQICIAHTWIRPVQAEAGYLFDDVDLARLYLILDLSDQMGANDEAIPIILSLVDQVQALRIGIRALDVAVATDDEATAATIAARLRDLLRWS